MDDIYLTQDVINHICFPLTQPAAQVRTLRAMGFTVLVRKDGSALVSRGNYERVTGGTEVPAKNDDDAEARTYRVGGGIGGNVVRLFGK